MARLSFRLPPRSSRARPHLKLSIHTCRQTSLRAISTTPMSLDPSGHGRLSSPRGMLHGASQALGKSSFRSHPSPEATPSLPCAPKPLYQRVPPTPHHASPGLAAMDSCYISSCLLDSLHASNLHCPPRSLYIPSSDLCYIRIFVSHFFLSWLYPLRWALRNNISH